MPNPTVSPIRSGASMLAELLNQRFDADATNRPSAVAPDFRLPSDPVMPWVTPKVPRVLADLMREVGRTVELDAGAYVFRRRRVSARSYCSRTGSGRVPSEVPSIRMQPRSHSAFRDAFSAATTAFGPSAPGSAAT